MKKIIYNQGFFNNPEIIESLTYLYKIYLDLELKDDISRAIEISNKNYKSDLFFPSPDVIEQKIKDIELEREVFEDEKLFHSYIKQKIKEKRDDYRTVLVQRYSDPSSPYEKRCKILEELNSLEAELIPESKDDAVDIKDISLKESYERRKNRGSGIKTGIEEIDEITGGISRGKCAVFFAPPACGKTMSAINMAYINQFEQNNNSLFITLEIPMDELKMKLAVRHTFGTNDFFSILSTIKGKLSPEEEKIMEKYESDMDTMRKSKLLLIDSEKLKIESVFSFKTQLVNLIDRHDLKTIYIDYVQLFKEFRPKSFNDEKEWLNRVVDLFRHISVSKDVTFVLLSQCNREGIKRGQSTDGYFSIHNLSEINSLERHAYYIISLFTNDELKSNSQIKFQLLKHRDGETIEEPKHTYFDPRYFYIGDALGASKSIFSGNMSKEVMNQVTEGLDEFGAFFES